MIEWPMYSRKSMTIEEYNKLFEANFPHETVDEKNLREIREELNRYKRYLDSNARFGELTQSNREYLVGLLEQECKLCNKINKGI